MLTKADKQVILVALNEYLRSQPNALEVAPGFTAVSARVQALPESEAPQIVEDNTDVKSQTELPAEVG